MVKVVKRNGSLADFDKSKISNAILKAMTVGNTINESIASQIADDAEHQYKDKEKVSISDIETFVFNELCKYGQQMTAKAYEGYRSIREFQRKASNSIEKQVKELVNGDSDYWNNENSNKNAKLVTTQRDYMAGIISKEITRKYILTPDVVQAHDDGIIHFHDIDYMGQNALTNCCLINLDDMLQYGTVINKVKIDKPHRLITATTLATQIITAVTSSQYGGATITLSHLAPFVRDSFNRYYAKYKLRNCSESKCEKFAWEDIKKEIEDAVQTFNYQINSMTTTNGQSPFITVFMYVNERKGYEKETAMLIEEFLRQRIKGMKNKSGEYVTQAFPKLIYVLDSDNVEPGTKYFWLTELAARCTAKRMNPDYVSAKIMKEYKGAVFPSMGCRSWLTKDRTTENLANAKNWEKGNKYYGRVNQGVVTINLPDVALSSSKDMDAFWKILDKRLELCHKALRIRHEHLLGTLSDVAPILWQDGAFARLAPHEKIDKLLYNGYSTISLGYAGLYECVKYMTGKSHADMGEGESFGLKVMQRLNDKCNEWKDAENIDYSVYGSPIESTTYKFAKCLKKRFGIVKGITDHDYITNSYHINVREAIDPFKKLDIESRFQRLSPGGAISYIECGDLTHNIPAVLSVLKHIYNTMVYAELNIKSDYCQVCGYDGEIKIIDRDGKLEWQCPNCGNTDQSKMNVARRTCGYIGTNYWNQGRTQEIAERYVHLTDIEDDEM
ncbi:anaerobic ribonucleoside-triphosphate reductase [Mitsuokella multacida]|uniref:Anaerobic ribonucleoside-triphosphate reductase n=1 Tax=Mitsuokella multacida DSM 20544 TaxID=500635 RepID=C9KJA2_9FIRM|nr:anaerobic ribonucleoside-triphosphate reductase [Mitsuokella multacida]EEX69968.1 anaerobic ribonucleoside-triphosphate reductase [Mitsuokella multacida DSM 20544]